jgi:hypothetical protein
MQKFFRLNNTGLDIILEHHENSSYDQVVEDIDLINEILICSYKSGGSGNTRYPFHLIEGLEIEILKNTHPEYFI